MRHDAFSRRLIRENQLCVDDLIQPLFVCAGKKQIQAVSSMPGVARYSIDCLHDKIMEISALDIPAVALFPVIDAAKKEPWRRSSL